MPLQPIITDDPDPQIPPFRNPLGDPPDMGPPDLCPRVNFRAAYRLRDGVGYTGWVSTRTTYVTPEEQTGTGDYKRIAAQLVYHRGRGTMCVAIMVDGFLCAGGFLPAGGHTRAATYGVLSGTVVIFTTSVQCIETRAVADGAALNCDKTVVNIDSHCNVIPSEGGFDSCIYCVDPEQIVQCSFEQVTHELPCTAFGFPGRYNVWIPPGARIIPRTGSHDINGNEKQFFANNGLTGLVKYFLKRFTGSVDPVFPKPNANCCWWLCRWTVHNQANWSWVMYCNSPIQYPQFQIGDERQPRGFILTPGRQPMFVDFAFGRDASTCFQLADQQCMTAGPDRTGLCGQLDPEATVDAPCWQHPDETEARLTVLDSMGVDLNMRLGIDPNRYPQKEPECTAIASDALKQVAHYVTNLNNPGHNRLNSYNQARLNWWAHTQYFGSCGEQPAVARGGTHGGNPWTVYVIPFGTQSTFPADLVFDQASFILKLSGDMGSEDRGGQPGNFGKLRIMATFDCHLILRPRLRPGWEAIECPIGFAGSNVCDMRWSDPNRAMIVASEGCSRVPLQVHWRGLLGPYPWSKIETPYLGDGSQECCLLLDAIHETVIPGEINDTGNPLGIQHYEGDVVLFLHAAPSQVC